MFSSSPRHQSSRSIQISGPRKMAFYSLLTWVKTQAYSRLSPFRTIPKSLLSNLVFRISDFSLLPCHPIPIPYSQIPPCTIGIHQFSNFSIFQFSNNNSPSNIPPPTSNPFSLLTYLPTSNLVYFPISNLSTTSPAEL